MFNAQMNAMIVVGWHGRQTQNRSRSTYAARACFVVTGRARPSYELYFVELGRKKTKSYPAPFRWLSTKADNTPPERRLYELWWMFVDWKFHYLCRYQVLYLQPIKAKQSLTGNKLRKSLVINWKNGAYRDRLFEWSIRFQQQYNDVTLRVARNNVDDFYNDW